MDPEQYRQMERHVPELEAVEPPRIKPRSLLLWIAAGVVSWLVLLALGWGLVHALAALQDATSRSAQEPFPYIGVGGSPALTGVPRIQRELALSGTPQAPRTISGTATQVGSASWYDDGPGHYAAAPWWRFGMDPVSASVCRIDAGRSDCTSVIVQDHCQCYVGESRERIIDLSPAAFAELAPLSVGIIRVQVDRGSAPRVTLPPTDSTSTEGGQP